jgi:3-dehydroquinate synthetase
MSFQMGLMSDKTKLSIEKHAIEILSVISWEKEWFCFDELFRRIKMDKKNSDVVRMILMDETKKQFVLKEVDAGLMNKSMEIVNNRLNLI